jgi:acetoin utilization protein AcuB
MKYEGYIWYKMRTDLVTISPEGSFYEARTLIHDKGIRHLPVVDKQNRLVGIITDKDIRAAGPSDATTLSIYELHYLLGKLKVSAFMTPRPKLVTIQPDTLFEEAVQIMRDYKVGCLPVVEGENLVGLVTETDVLDAFADIMGSSRGGTRLVVAVEDEPGKMLPVLEVVKQNQVNVFTTFSPSYQVEGKRIIVLRLATQAPEKIIEELKESGVGVLSVKTWPLT